MTRHTNRRFVVCGLLAIGLLLPVAWLRWSQMERGPVAWRIDTGSPILGSPAVSASRLFIGSEDQTLRAFSLPDRQPLWTAILPDAPGSDIIQDEERGLLYLTTLGGRIICLDAATGEPSWERSVASFRFRGSPALAGGLLILGMQDGWIYAMEPTTGRLRWQVFAGGAILGDTTGEGDTVVVGTQTGLVHSLDARTGLERWVTDLGSSIDGTPTLAGNVVLIGARDHQMHALDRETGELLWETQAFHDITAAPVVTEDRIIVGSWDHHLMCLDRDTGRIIWRHRSQDVIEAAAVIAGETVVAASRDGRAYALDLETGEVQWVHRTGTWITASPMMTTDGELFLVASEDGTLTALRR